MFNTVVRILLKGAEISDNGNYFLYNGAKSQLTFMAGNQKLKIDHVYFGESVDSSSVNLNFDPATIHSVSFGGNSEVTINANTTRPSDWIDLPIDIKKNYILSYAITGNPGSDSIRTWTDYQASFAPATPATTQLIKPIIGKINTVANNLGSLSTSDPDIDDIKEIYQTLGLAAVQASYVTNGTYTSDIMNTMLDAPQYEYISWNATVPSGTQLELKIRTGNNPDLSDAPSWSNLTSFASSPQAISSAYKRYVQFQALMESDSSRTKTPTLNDVTIDWTGEQRMVNVQGRFTKGPDYGKFELSIDDKPLQSALIVDLKIFKRSPTMNQKTFDISSSIKVEITPRNSGL